MNSMKSTEYIALNICDTSSQEYNTLFVMLPPKY